MRLSGHVPPKYLPVSCVPGVLCQSNSEKTSVNI